ncbi:conserved protein of unknown function [Nitrospira japonica]|uniref:Uncharacterized protein n=1 Tax=Nitrospira japonica TaxID=1325564 RepID=A0A1W1I4G2_9BACT|nr:hypothetical protein [Nitrospira japonica]SLM47759.1 conserved protein of unknown function [Nitrospira japonica]
MGAPMSVPSVQDERSLGNAMMASVPEKRRQLPPRKVRLTVNLPQDLVEQVRDAVFWTPGLTIAWLIARAMRISLADMHSTNHGPFPRRSRPLRAGRPKLTGQTMNLQMSGKALPVGPLDRP